MKNHISNPNKLMRGKTIIAVSFEQMVLPTELRRIAPVLIKSAE